MNSNSKGFTLIELLVVVAIIGVLATIALTSLFQARVKTLDTQRFTEVISMQKALELYYLDNGEYPQGYIGSASAYNCQNANSRWVSLATELSDYISLPMSDNPWPVCIWYYTNSYPHCDAVVDPGYTIFFGTDSAVFSNLDPHNQGAYNSKNRYCVYSLE